LSTIKFYKKIDDFIISCVKPVKSKIDIEISEKDVQIILENSYTIFRSITLSSIYCTNCDKGYTGSTIGYKIILNNLNDVVIRGVCSKCRHKVGRYIEFGEDPIISKRADSFRDTLEGNKI